MGNTVRSCCGGHATDDTPTQKPNLTTTAQADDAIAQYPVMAGTLVDKAATETVPDFTANLIDQLESTGPAGP